jgi:hypothetical protein
MIEIDRDRLIEIKRWTSSYDEHANALLPDNSLYATSERSGFFYSTIPMNERQRGDRSLDVAHQHEVLTS